MKLSNDAKKVLRFTAFVFGGVVFFGCFIYTSESLGITRFNFSLFGGPSWAVWLYPIYLLIAFVLSALLFRMSRGVYIAIVATFLLLFAFLLYPSPAELFHNWKPFRIDAY